MLRTVSIRMVLILAPIDTEEEVNGTALVGETGVTGGRGHHIELPSDRNRSQW